MPSGQIGKLTALAVSLIGRRGYHSDGGGLYLQVSANKTKSWVFRFKADGRLREMGLGSVHSISLAEAREHATECRKLRLRGIDPIEARNAARIKTKLEAARAMTFRQCAEAYIDAHQGNWSNRKHAAQWRSTLERYAYPVLGDLPLQSIDVALVTKAIEPIWKSKTETASRLRARIEKVLDWAAVRGYRQGDDAARWRGRLDKFLPARTGTQEARHHAALPYREIGLFMAQLREQESIAAQALEFIVLTAARTGEATGATWSEFDLDGAVWIIPAARMKARKEHRVPLSRPAMAIIRRLHAARSGEFVFPGARRQRPLSHMAPLALLKRMNREALTVHGFRSTFRDWAIEGTNFPRTVTEQALAHSLPDKVEAAQEAELFEKRRKMMEAWGRFCSIWVHAQIRHSPAQIAKRADALS